MIHGSNFAYFTTIEEQTKCDLGNWWYITSTNCRHVIHFLTYDLKALCGAELKGNHLIPDTREAMRELNMWMKGSRCQRCESILKSRKERAERDTIRALRKAGFIIQHSDTDYLENDGYLPLYVVVYAPVKGLVNSKND